MKRWVAVMVTILSVMGLYPDAYAGGECCSRSKSAYKPATGGYNPDPRMDASSNQPSSQSLRQQYESLHTSIQQR